MRIEKNLDVLASDQPNMPTRHRSVRAVLDYSWKLLSPTERNTFAALSVFRAGFNLDAAEEVAKAPLSQLFSLVDKSLLRRTPLGRYEMHELVRQYGEEKLDAVEDEDWRDTTVHARMARYFLQFAQDHAKDYPALEPEWGNFLAALRAAHERYEWPIVTELAQTLIDPWFTRARFTDAREGLALATTAASNDDDLTALANVLRWRGRACIEQAQYDEATSYLDHALQFADALDDASLIGVLEFSKGDVLTELGDYSNAELLLRNSIDRLRAIDDHKNVREASQLLARLYCDLQEFDKAAQIARDTLIATEGITHDRASLMLTWTLATAENERGNHEQARDLCEQCLSSCNLLQNQNEMVNTLYVYGQVLHRSKDFAEAHRKLAACLTLAKTLGRRKLSAHTTLYMSYVQRDSGQYDSAIACTNQSLDLYGTLKDSYSSVIAMRHLGDLYQSIGNIERACQVWHQAFSTARDTRHPLCASIEQRIAQFDKKSP
jgi:tetratricopeptide (TPR) repeat protein